MTQLLESDLLPAQQKHRQARKLLQAMHALNPERYSAVEKQINLLVQNRKLSDARHLANRYLRQSTDPNPRAWRELASIQERLGELDAVARLVRLAVLLAALRPHLERPRTSAAHRRVRNRLHWACRSHSEDVVSDG